MGGSWRGINSLYFKGKHFYSFLAPAVFQITVSLPQSQHVSLHLSDGCQHSNHRQTHKYGLKFVDVFVPPLSVRSLVDFVFGLVLDKNKEHSFFITDSDASAGDFWRDRSGRLGQTGGVNSQTTERGAEIHNQKSEYLVQG